MTIEPLHVKLFFNTLFTDFPREVGFPARRRVNSFQEFLDLAYAFHQNSPVFIQLYKIYNLNQDVEIDKLWIDFDDTNQYTLMKELKIVYYRLISLGFDPMDIVPAYTGKKGFHIYAKLIPKMYTIEEAKEYLNWIISYLCYELKTPDSPLFSDTNRIVRVWGIQRPEGTFMIGLNPDFIFKYKTINDYFVKHKLDWKKLMKLGNQYLKRMNGGADVDLLIIKDKIKKTGFKLPKQNYSINDLDKISDVSPITKSGKGDYYDYLKLLMKNKITLFYAIHAPNPRHIDRVRFAILLQKTGLPISNIMEIMESLRWLDWDPEVTEYHLKHIKGKYNL